MKILSGEHIVEGGGFSQWHDLYSRLGHDTAVWEMSMRDVLSGVWYPLRDELVDYIRANFGVKE